MRNDGQLKIRKPGSDIDLFTTPPGPMDHGYAASEPERRDKSGNGSQDHSQRKASDKIEVADHDEVVAAKTISEWTKDWLRWGLQAPNNPDQNPLLDDDGAAAGFNNDGPVFFIAGGFNNPSLITRTFEVPANTPILFPMISAFDTEGPGIETLPGFPGSYADEAAYITGHALDSIYKGYVKLTNADSGKPLLNIRGNEAFDFIQATDIFSIGAPVPGSFLADGLLGGTTLDPSIADLPFSREIGLWVMIEGLAPGDYALEFGGSGHKVINPLDPSGNPIFSEGWGAAVRDTIHVVNNVP